MIETFKSLNYIEIELIIFFLVLFIYQVVHPWISYRKLLFYKQVKPAGDGQLLPISVIICAKNESPNLLNFLPKVLEQDYPNFQVVVVNDCSCDNTVEVLENFQKTHPNLYFTSVKADPIYRHGKKLAVALGIKAAKHEHLVFIDADCYPTSKHWLKGMASHFSDTIQIVIGTSPYENKKGLLSKLIGYETLYTAITYVSSAMKGKAYMAVGRNMAYTKSIFNNNHGFSGHMHVLSGDDDLFVNKAATKKNAAVEISSSSLVYSLPATSWSKWLKQKRRHMSTGKYYKQRDKVRFAMEAMMSTLFNISIIALIMMDILPLFVLALYAFTLTQRSIVNYIGAKKLNFDKSYALSFLWLRPVVLFLRSYMLFLNFIRPQKFQWR